MPIIVKEYFILKMIRKSLIILLSLFSLMLPLFAEDVEVEQTLTQYEFIQHFKWLPTEKARKYEVIIEKFENDNWVPDVEKKTKDTSILIPLTPGKKRISVVSLNRLGRKGQQTDWIEFVVLGETQPYLYADYLKKSKAWNSPVLMVTHGENDDLSEKLNSETGDPENSFFLKGKNIFLTETKFYMVPVDSPTMGGNPFQSYNSLRKQVPLEIFRRDFDRSGVVVQYNSQDLYSGYYQIYAENPGNQKTYLDILVLANREPKINEAQFEYYPNYEVRLLDRNKIRNSGNLLYVEGSGFTGDTRFTLTPSSQGIPYPFTSSMDREKLELSVSEVQTLNSEGDSRLSFVVNPSAILPGYYNFVAENSMGRSTVFLLVKDWDKEKETPSVSSASTAKNSKDLTITLKGRELTKDCQFTLISSIAPDTGLNTRIPFPVVDSKRTGKKIIIQGDRENVKEGIYAFLIEKSGLSVVRFISFNKALKSKVIELSDEEIAEHFLRSEHFVPSVSVEEYIAGTKKELSYNIFEYKPKRRQKVILPFVELNLDLLPNKFFELPAANDNDYLPQAGLTLPLINFNWMTLGVSGAYSTAYFYDAEAYLNLALPFAEFKPYVGAGVGCNFFFNTKSEPVDYFFQTKTPDYGIYAFAHAGVVLFDIFDIHYTMHLSGADTFVPQIDWSTPDVENTGLFLYNDFSIGFRIPVRKFVYKKKPLNYALTVTKKGIVSGQDYKIKKPVKKLEFANDVTEVRYFGENELLESVVLPDTIKVIGAEAFADCPHLRSINLPDGLEEIGDRAFAGCTSISSVLIPSSVKKISASAFEGWESYQNIYLNWNEDDETVRDLSGLPYKRYAGRYFNNAKTKNTAIASQTSLSEIQFAALKSENASTSIMSYDETKNGTSRKVYKFMSSVRGNENNTTGMLASISYQQSKLLKEGDGIRLKVKGDSAEYKISFKNPNGTACYVATFWGQGSEQELVLKFSDLIFENNSNSVEKSFEKMEIGSIWFTVAKPIAGKKYNLEVSEIASIKEGN